MLLLVFYMIDVIQIHKILQIQASATFPKIILSTLTLHLKLCYQNNTTKCLQNTERSEGKCVHVCQMVQLLVSIMCSHEEPSHIIKQLPYSHGDVRTSCL